MSKPINVIIFDMAGTTVQDDGQIVAKCFQQALRTLNREFDLETINEVMGWPKKKAIRNLYQQRTDAVHDFFEKLMITHYKDNGVEMTGATSLFREIRKDGGLVALNTGFSRKIADAIIEKLNWKDEIDLCVTSDEAPFGRPEPHMIWRVQDLVYKLVGDVPRRWFKIGDTPSDVLEGVNALIDTFGVCTGAYTRDQLNKFVKETITPHKSKSDLDSGRNSNYAAANIKIVENIQEAYNEIRENKTWVVRANCEYSLEVQAKTAEEATKDANEIDYDDWIQAWAPTEVEEEMI